MGHNFKGSDSGSPSQRDPLCRLRALGDEELAGELARERHDALTVLFERHSGLVFRIARRILRNDGEAEETVQQVFLNVYRSIGQFDPEKGTFKTWLLQFAYHRAINRREHLISKRFYDAEQLDEEWIEGNQGEVGKLLQQSPQETSHLINQLLIAIKPAQRTVIELTFFHGLTAEEIAERTGQTASVVRHNLYRGLKKLRSLLVEQKLEARKKGSETGTRDKGFLIAYRPPTF